MSTAPEADPNRIASAAAQTSAAACGQRRSQCCAGWERRTLAAGRPRSPSHAHNQCLAGVRPAVRQELAPPAAESWAARDGIPCRGRSVVARRSETRACARRPPLAYDLREPDWARIGRLSRCRAFAALVGAGGGLSCAGDISMQAVRDQKFGRRRMLAVSLLVLGVTVVSTVGACAESDKFNFKPRGTESPIRHGG